MLINLLLYVLLFINFTFSQVYQNGEYVNNLFGNICGNGGSEWSLSTKELNNVIFISSFASWFKHKGVEVIGAGMDWNNPYSCKEWAKNFNLTSPILDDSEGDKIYNYFGNGVVPYNIVIDRNGQLVYSASGFNKNEIVSAIKKGLKQSKKENPLLKETQLKQQNKTRYMQLRENKGFD
jgi:hypothetical protein